MYELLKNRSLDGLVNDLNTGSPGGAPYECHGLSYDVLSGQWVALVSKRYTYTYEQPREEDLDRGSMNHLDDMSY